MKKIPTIWNRDDNGEILVGDWAIPLDALNAKNVYASGKMDGTCCTIDRNRTFWARREIKEGKAWPEGFVAVGEHNGKTQGWIPVTHEPQWKWHNEAFGFLDPTVVTPGTYELIGPKIQGNPHGADPHQLWRHGQRMFSETEGEPVWDEAMIRQVLEDKKFEGIVWWVEDGPFPFAKVKRRDLGLPWPPK